jgi:hypothetical protein
MSNWLNAKLEDVEELTRDGFIKPPITKVYELWGSTGDYSDYQEMRLACCSSQEELDKTVERLLAMENIEQAGPHRKNEKKENYIVMKDKNGHWRGRVLWQQYAPVMKSKFDIPRMSRQEEMEIWSNVEELDVDHLDILKTNST